ncbi:hypothetical protein HZA97_08660 [Candidatus Woesearchaeota archaeon]|nr:hypothetical protein [Candidatus Woesearchaeota archaeon]
MSIDDKVSVMLEVKEGTKREVIKSAVERLGYALDENYRVPMPTNKPITIIYLISGQRNDYNTMQETLKKEAWFHAVFGDPKMEYFEGDDIINEWGEQK